MHVPFRLCSLAGRRQDLCHHPAERSPIMAPISLLFSSLPSPSFLDYDHFSHKEHHCDRVRQEVRRPGLRYHSIISHSV